VWCQNSYVIARFQLKESAVEFIREKRKEWSEDTGVDIDSLIDLAEISEWALHETMRRDPFLLDSLHTAGLDALESRAVQDVVWGDKDKRVSADMSEALRGLYIPHRISQLERKVPVFVLPINNRYGHDYSNDGFEAARAIASVVIIPE